MGQSTTFNQMLTDICKENINLLHNLCMLENKYIFDLFVYVHINVMQRNINVKHTIIIITMYNVSKRYL